MKKLLLAVVSSLLVAACTSSTPGGMSRWMEAYGPELPRAEAGPGRALYRAG